MLRTIVQPADLSGDALAEFKEWLGISRPGEDAMLLDLLAASLAMCEAFTGQAPIEQRVEELFPAKHGRYFFASRPVRSSLSVDAVGADGTRSAVATEEFQFGTEASGIGSIDLEASTDAAAVAVQILAGIASSWSETPKPLRQGIIRLAAHYYRDRDRESSAKPPASVTALWRPWRVMRLT